MGPNAYLGQQQQSQTAPHYGLLYTIPSDTDQPALPNTPSRSLDDISRHGYALTTSHGQADDGPTQSMTRKVYRLARHPIQNSAHAARVVENERSAPLQPIQRRPAPIVKSNDLESHVYTGQQ